MSPIDIYQPRNFRHHGLWTVGDLRLKVYEIHPDGQASIAPALMHSAQQFIGAHIPAARADEGEDHALGYVVVHAGKMANWLLVHWWAYGDIVLASLASAAPDSTFFTSRDERRFHACVWEQTVISHERDAWVRTLMSPRGKIEDYLEDTLQDGKY